MTGRYATDHAGAVADVAAAGAAVSFTLTTPGTYDATTDTYSTPTTVTVSGYAIETGNDPDVYIALSLIQSNPATLFFTPSTYGAFPKLGYAVTWGGIAFTVKKVTTLSPDGVVIAAWVVIAT